MGSLQVLLGLQRIDTRLMQLTHRVANLEELTILTAAKAKSAAAVKQLSAFTTHLDNAKSEISSIESANKKCEATIVRYSAQLKTVIAPREAEALQHEIETVRSDRSINDDKELALFETIEKLEIQISDVQSQLVLSESEIAEATNALTMMLKTCENERAQLEASRVDVASKVEAKLINLYDLKRNKRTTPAVADLHGSKCQSCHLDLSVVEIAKLKKVGVDDYAVCPSCDCFLAV